MTADRVRLRARLVSALDEAGDIETRPIEEVRAALREQGIDPTASIRLAQKLFSRGSAADDPAARLLEKIARSEAVDAEIATLEDADIDDIMAALPWRQTVERRQRADRSSPENVTPIEPRRRRLPALGLGGSLIGIAASVLLFIVVRPDQLKEVEVLPSSIEAGPPAAADADAAVENALPGAEEVAQKLSPELAQLQGKASAGRERFAVGQADLADALVEAPVAGAGRRALQSLDEHAAGPLAESRERVFGEETELDLSSDVTVSNTSQLQSLPHPKPRPDLTEDERAELVLAAPTSSRASALSKAAPPKDPPRPMPRPDVGESGEESVGVETAVVTSRSAPLSATAADLTSMPEPPFEPAVLVALLTELKAVYLVDERRAPTSLRIAANRLPEGRLAAKLGEAELRASGRNVVALVAFARDGEIVEAALVETPGVHAAPDLSGQTVTGFTGFAEGEPAVLHRSETSFELIDLSADR